MTTLHGRAAPNFTSSSGCEQIVSEHTHIAGGVLDLVLTDVPGLIGLRVGSTLRTSDHTAIFIEVVLEQPIPHLVCKQEACLKN